MRLTIQQQFEQFHRDNPSVYTQLVVLARQYHDHGVRTIGIGHLWEVLRWQRIFESKSLDAFKLNNNFRSRYARLICEQEPDLADLFETRRLLAA